MLHLQEAFWLLHGLPSLLRKPESSGWRWGWGLGHHRERLAADHPELSLAGIASVSSSRLNSGPHSCKVTGWVLLIPLAAEKLTFDD